MKRRFWHSSWLTPNYDPNKVETREPVEDESKANLIGSLLEDGRHMPCIDIDLPCRLVESETPGHFHLFIDHPIHWANYKAILEELTNAGIVQVGYFTASQERGQTFVASKPWKSANSDKSTVKTDTQVSNDKPTVVDLMANLEHSLAEAKKDRAEPDPRIGEFDEVF